MDEAARSLRRCDAAESWCGRVDRIVDKSGIANRLVAPRTNRRIGGSTRGETKRPPMRSSKWLNSNRIGEGRASGFLSPVRHAATAAQDAARRIQCRFKLLHPCIAVDAMYL